MKKIKNILNDKKLLLNILQYVIICLIIFLCFYVQLIQNPFCGPKSKVLYTVLSIAIFITIGVLIIIFSKKKESLKPEKVFLILAIALGTIYMVSTPMFKGHDEQYHWYKAYAISLGEFLPEKKDGMVGNYIPKEAVSVFEMEKSFLDINYKTIINTEKYSYNNRSMELEFVDNTPTKSYPAIQYFPQALGIAIARLVGFSIYVQAYFGRFFNLLFFVITGFIAIKWSKKYGWFLLVFLMSPKILYISSTLNGDIFINGTALLLITYVIKQREEKNILNLKNFLFLFTLSICLSISKIVYFPVVLFTTLLPKECFKNKKSKIIIVASLLVITAITCLGWYKLINITSVATTEKNIQQLEFVKSNPIIYLGIVGRGIMTNFATWAIDMTGGYMEWGRSLIQPEIISIAFYVIMFLALTQYDMENLKRYEKFIILIIIAAVTFGIISAMYITWTPLDAKKIGDTEILGVQGRYFVPITLLIAYIIPTKYIKRKINVSNLFFIVSILIFEIPSIINIFVRNI